MKGALIHGLLLAVMLVYGYRTWTRDKTVEPTLGAVVLWDKAEADLASIELTTDKKVVKLEHRGAGADAYWWGSDTTITRTPKAVVAPPAADAGVADAATIDAATIDAGPLDAGVDAGAPADGGAIDAGAPPVEMVETRTTREFPLGDSADKVIAGLTAARALRDLGVATAENKKDYKLVDTKASLVVAFKDGPRKFVVGGSVFGGSDRYVLEESTGKAYVLSRDLVAALELGEPGLHLVDPRGFEGIKLDQVVVDVGGKTRTAAKVQTGVEGQQVKTWGDPATGKTDQTLGNFVDNAGNLRPMEYKVELKIAELTPVLALTFKDVAGTTLGTMALYKKAKPVDASAPVPAGPVAANPEFDYFIVTPKTRVPALVNTEMAKRIEDDIPTLWGAKPATPPAMPANPHGAPGGGNPFGTPAPSPVPHGSVAPAEAPRPVPAPVPVPVVPAAPKAPVPVVPAAPKAAVPAPAPHAP
jgi:hypothetical protein